MVTTPGWVLTIVCVVWQSAVKNVFIRGSVVRYVHLPANAVDIPLLEDATRRGEFQVYAFFETLRGVEADMPRAEAANQAGKGK